MKDVHAAKVTGTPRPASGDYLRADYEASGRAKTLNLGGFYTPDTRRITYGSAGVSGGGGQGGKVSQAGRARRSSV